VTPAAEGNRTDADSHITSTMSDPDDVYVTPKSSPRGSPTSQLSQIHVDVQRPAAAAAAGLLY